MAITQILGKKIGTTQVFREDGSADCVTAIQVSPCTVTQIKSSSIDGYESVQLGFETVKKSTKPKIGHFKKSSDELFRYLREVRSDGTEDINIGDKFDSSIFEPGERLNITGISKGRGFQGGVKRHHFRGGPGAREPGRSKLPKKAERRAECVRAEPWPSVGCRARAWPTPARRSR